MFGGPSLGIDRMIPGCKQAKGNASVALNQKDSAAKVSILFVLSYPHEILGHDSAWPELSTRMDLYTSNESSRLGNIHIYDNLVPDRVIL